MLPDSTEVVCFSVLVLHVDWGDVWCDVIGLVHVIAAMMIMWHKSEDDRCASRGSRLSVSVCLRTVLPRLPGLLADWA